MTSTSTFKGMDSESKPSSRVLAPPGGGSSNIFGLAQPEVKQAPQKKEPEPAAPAPKPAAAAEAAAAQPTASPATDSGPVRSIRSAPKQAFNPITGEPYETADSKQKKEEPSSTSASKEDNSKEGKENGQQAAAQKPKPSSVDNTDRTCTRIAQPPGGKSSGLW